MGRNGEGVGEGEVVGEEDDEDIDSETDNDAVAMAEAFGQEESLDLPPPPPPPPPPTTKTTTTTTTAAAVAAAQTPFGHHHASVLVPPIHTVHQFAIGGLPIELGTSTTLFAPARGTLAVEVVNIRDQVYNLLMARCVNNKTGARHRATTQLWNHVHLGVGQTRRLKLDRIKHYAEMVGQLADELMHDMQEDGAGVRLESAFRVDGKRSLLAVYLGGEGGDVDGDGGGAVHWGQIHAAVSHVIGVVRGRIRFWPANPIALFVKLLSSVHCGLVMSSVKCLGSSQYDEEKLQMFWTLLTSASFLSVIFSGSGVMKTFQMFPQLSMDKGRMGSLLRHLPPTMEQVYSSILNLLDNANMDFSDDDGGAVTAVGEEGEAISATPLSPSLAITTATATAAAEAATTTTTTTKTAAATTTTTTTATATATRTATRTATATI